MIVIFSGNDWSVTNSGSILGLEGLESFVVIELNHANIIDIVQEVGIIFNRLVETLEGIIEILLFNYTMNQLIHSHLNTTVELISVILHLVSVNVGWVVSAIKTYIYFKTKLDTLSLNIKSGNKMIRE